MNAKRYDVVPAALPPMLPAVTRNQARQIANAVLRKLWPTSYQGAPHLYSEYRVRRVWISTKPTAASNSDKGVGRIIHDLSHDIFEAWYPNRRPHDPLHAEYERNVAAFVAEYLNSSRWIVDAPVKPKPTLAQKRGAELIRVESAIVRWQTKAKRAANALRKLRTKQRRLIKLTGAKP